MANGIAMANDDTNSIKYYQVVISPTCGFWRILKLFYRCSECMTKVCEILKHIAQDIIIFEHKGISPLTTEEP